MSFVIRRIMWCSESHPPSHSTSSEWRIICSAGVWLALANIYPPRTEWGNIRKKIDQAKGIIGQSINTNNGTRRGGGTRLVMTCDSDCIMSFRWSAARTAPTLSFARMALCSCWRIVYAELRRLQFAHIFSFVKFFRTFGGPHHSRRHVILLWHSIKLEPLFYLLG